VGAAEMSIKPRTAPKKAKDPEAKAQKKISGLEVEILFLERRIKAQEDLMVEMSGVLQKIATTFIGSVPLSDLSYIHSVHISKALMDDVYEALKRWR
jgi:hypothetical protein